MSVNSVNAKMISLAKRKRDLKGEIISIERQIFDIETSYLEDTREFGSVFSGWKHLIDSDKSRPRKVVFNDEKLFSLSSMTSPASRKVASGEKRSHKTVVNSEGIEVEDAAGGENDEKQPEDGVIDVKETQED